ncbi:MAG: YolD-like family protein [Oscillospiraceae bacterium]|nr:YolD-like family protein [Oscillospiraceae bacterium]
MASRPEHRMSISDRAKQFSSFDALSGLEAALERKRRELGLFEKPILGEDALDALNEKLSELSKGKRVSIKYYSSGEFHVSSGVIAAVDKTEHFISLDGERISFDDIDDILFEIE